MPAATQKKKKSPSLDAEALFRLFDSHLKKPKFYAALERYLAAGGAPDAPHPGFYGNDAHRGMTMLENAIGANDAKTVKLLVDAGADVNHKPRFGETLIAQAMHLPRIRMMLEKAAGTRGEAKSMADELELLISKTGYTISYGRFSSATHKKKLQTLLERRGAKAAEELLQILLTHSDTGMRSSAAEALALLGDVETLRTALARVEGTDTLALLTRRWIAHAFASLGARREVEALAARTDDPALSQILSTMTR